VRIYTIRGVVDLSLAPKGECHWEDPCLYYFDGVEDGDGPYALWAFFDPATLVSATFDDQSNTTDVLAVNGRYLLEGSRWYVGGRYSANRYDYDDPSVLDADGDAYGILVGKHLGPRTTLELAFERSDEEYTHNVTLNCLVPPCPVTV
jgi:hypothetical protein